MREFHSYSEMSKEDFRSLQTIELEIFLYLDKFCKDHNLRYFIAGGTLIGAIRHKGFIPWDEDIDTHMPRPDYEKLPELWDKYADKEKYTLCVTNENKNFRHHAYSICNNNTTFIEERTVNDDIAQGIRIDILPFDGVPKGKIRQWIQFFWAILFSIYNVQRMPENQGGTAMRLGVKIALTLVRNPHKRYMIWMYAKKQLSKYSFDESPYVREFICPFRSMQFLYPRKDFDKTKIMQFEGHMVPAQHYYKKYLENVYPGYMKVPPKDKQKPKGKIVYLNLDKSYKEYKGIYYCKNQ